MILDVVSGVLIVAGVAFLALGLVGVVRLPDYYSRTHAVAKVETLGMLLVFAGLLLYLRGGAGTAQLVLIALFLWLTRRIMHIGRQAIALDQVFAGLVAQGVGLWFGFQAFINIGVNLGALPTKGLTLPFMSYGGSAILLNMVALALVLRVDYENRQLMRGARA